MQNNLYKKAIDFNKKHTTNVDAWKEFEDIALNKGGFIQSFWCGNPDCAKGIREIKKYSVRIINPIKTKKNCVHCSKKAAYEVAFAPAY